MESAPPRVRRRRVLGATARVKSPIDCRRNHPQATHSGMIYHSRLYIGQTARTARDANRARECASTIEFEPLASINARSQTCLIDVGENVDECGERRATSPLDRA